MATIKEKQQFHFSIIPTSIPIQIWPEPVPEQKRKRMESLQKFSEYIIIFAIIIAIFSNSYFVISKFIPQSSTPKTTSIPAAPFNNIFQSIINSNISNDLPIRLKIPGISVDAAIQQVGLTPEGALDVPDNTIDVGWYKFGPRPGQKGSAVLDGHIDGPDGLPAVFSQLHTLKVGDSIIVINDKNKPIYFTVTKINNYANDDYASDIFNRNDGIHLNLITCNGAWDANKNTYTDRLVVFADSIQL